MRNQDANRPQRIKIIIITVIVAILVFIFGAWLITSAIKSVEKKNQSTQTVETGKTAKKDEKTIIDDKKQEQNTQNTSKNNSSVSNVNNNSAANSPATQYSVGQHSSTTVAQNTGLPTTGPEDLLPTALLIGIASFLFFKNREIREKLSLQNS